MKKKVILNFSRKLKRLNLGGNDLTAVPTRALSNMGNLKELDMQENKISEISEEDFEGKFVLVFIPLSLFLFYFEMPPRHHDRDQYFWGCCLEKFRSPKGSTNLSICLLSVN